ncbi:hypothetical protein AcW1_001329 [Taiwanofungus camphoratus]|nr:hypothetical protein AcW2_000140 [Antrodia cinnamomea]KAI0964529.1 hypothetical protein AcW1_001329 [Antrodia cinnamomea]
MDTEGADYVVQDASSHSMTPQSSTRARLPSSNTVCMDAAQRYEDMLSKLMHVLCVISLYAPPTRSLHLHCECVDSRKRVGRHETASRNPSVCRISPEYMCDY